MKLEKLNVNNLGGGDLVQQIEAALIQIRDNINKYGAARVPALGKRSTFDFDSYLLRGKEVVKPPCALFVEPVFCV